MIGRWLLAVLIALALGSTWRLDGDPEGLDAVAADKAEAVLQAPADARLAIARRAAGIER